MPKKISKTKKRVKNPPDIKDIPKSLIKSVFDKVDKMEFHLSTFNLKYDEFPNIKKWVDEHFILPFGKIIVLRYLTMIAKNRAENYWTTKFKSQREIKEEFSLRSKYWSLKKFYETGKYEILSPEEISNRLDSLAGKREEKNKKSIFAYRPAKDDEWDV